MSWIVDLVYMKCCPKCGFQQEDGVECQRCGVVFSRYHTPVPPKASSMPKAPVRTTRSTLFRFYRVFRWFSLAVLILALILIFRTAPPPLVVVAPDAVLQADGKIREFLSSVKRGAEATLELDQSDLNGWLGVNLGFRRPVSQFLASQTQESLFSLAKTAAGGQRIDEIEQEQSPVHDVKIELREDTLLLYTIFDLHGIELSLQIEGPLSVKGGYLCMEPTGGKLGSFPLVLGTLRAVKTRLFDSPANREQFKLPQYIKDVRIEHGNLVITSR